ncbi:hypothetical protein FACS189496_3640 [Bacilli bacterium]|nr:hypothetical protein FACS189496_3640 [Bacilli bacterium]
MANKKKDKDIVTVVGTSVEDVRKLGAIELMWRVFEMKGGVTGLKRWADSNEDAFYGKIFAKRIPQAVEISGAADNNTPININIPALLAKV